ncbi:MAG: hypothetical protein RIT04_621 [Candidatus Parcubacteria bacterium]|jgi:hypothetical protein
MASHFVKEMVQRKLPTKEHSMGKALSSDQEREITSRFITQVQWSQLDGDNTQKKVIELSPAEFGRRFTLFLQNGCNPTITAPGTLPIDRSRPFNPAKFIGGGWTIWKGPEDGDGLTGKEEQDERSLAITEINLANLIIQTGLREGETRVTGEAKQARLMLTAIQADAKIAQMLYEEEGQTTLRWMYKHLDVSWIEFLGTTLRDPRGSRIALCLYRRDGGLWSNGARYLNEQRYATSPALGFAK